jgi:hypothetical protein
MAKHAQNILITQQGSNPGLKAGENIPVAELARVQS